MSVTDKIKDSVKEIKDDIKGLAHWRHGHKQKLPVHRQVDHPFLSLQQEMNRVFDDFYRSFGLFGGSDSPFGGTSKLEPSQWPRVDVTQTDKQICVKAELPGMEEKDIDVSISDDELTIRGEKKVEEEDKGKDYYRLECSYGSFHRTIPLPCEVETDKAEASFKKGVLTVSLPKSQRVLDKTKKIQVKHA